MIGEQWRITYDRWKTEAPDEHLSPEEQDAQAEDAAIERAERAREDAMFDHDNDPSREVW